MISCSSSSRSTVVVIGAGLTGMSAALELQELKVDHRVLETLAVAGGHAVTVEDSGYRFDRTGHLLHMRDDSLRESVLDWLDGDVFDIQRRSVIWSNGVYTDYPFQANTHGLPPSVAYDCLLGFIRAHTSRDTVEPTNFEEFCVAHFGEGISRHFMVPYNSRLWGVSPRDVTAECCGRFLPIPSLEDVVAGAVGHHRPELGYNARFLYPRRGIGDLSEAMCRRVAHLQFCRTPVSIDWRRRRLRLAAEELEYRVLVNTAPLPALSHLLESPPPEVVESAQSLRHTSLYYLDVALASPCLKDVHWVYVPEAQYPFYRVGCYSHFSPEMAPSGTDGLYVELADREPPRLDRLLPEVAEALVSMGLIAGLGSILFARVRKLDYAYVIFDRHYLAATRSLHAFLADHNIVSTGRYGGWNYSSMEDALRFGRDAARAAIELSR